MVKKYKVSKSVSEEPSLIIYDQLMLTPGIWNGVKFTKDQILFGINNTDWNNPENFALIDHHPKQGEIPNSTSWQGYFEGIKYKTLEDGVNKEGMYGDLHIYDPILASKILSKKSPLAVSIDASYSYSDFGANRLSFTNTALVYRPGCKDAYIQLEDNGDNHRMRIICEEDVSVDKEESIKSVKLSYQLETDKLVQVYNKENELLFEGSVLSFNKDENEVVMVSILNGDEIEEFNIDDHMFFPIMPREQLVVPEEDTEVEKCSELEDVELAKVTDMEATRKKMGMSVSEFYAIPRDPPSESKLPIFDETHVRNAMARFNQIKGVSSEEKSKAKSKILSKAKKYGIDVKEFTKLEEIKEEVIEELDDYRVERGSKKFEDKMNSKEIESLVANLIEKKFEELSAKLEEVKESNKVEKPTEEAKLEDESKEEVKEESESSEEKVEVEESEPEKVEEETVSEESEEKEEEVKEESEKEDEHVQESEVEALKSKVLELEAKLAEKEDTEDKVDESNNKTEDVELESQEDTVAEAKSVVQLEGEEKSEPEKKVQLSKAESIVARLNNEIKNV